MKQTSTNISVAFKYYLVLILTGLSLPFNQFVLTGKKKTVHHTILGNGLKFLLICMASWLTPSKAKADTPIPTNVVSNYNAALQRLTMTINWTWGTTASNKHVGAAVFADLNGDGITPTIFDNPATYNSGGNAFPAGLQARDEFIGQLAVSNIEGSASSSLYAGSDNTDNGIASGVSGITTTSARLLLPYLGNSMAVVNSSTGTFTITFSNVPVSPTMLCVVLFDPHTPFVATGGHSVTSAGTGRNTDNSIEDGNSQGTVPCNSLVVLNCAINKTETACQTQAAINASYAAWLASVTASGCNGVLTNNSTGAPSASGDSKTVTFTYTQSSCSNQAAVTTCTATFTVPPCSTCTGRVTSLYFNELNGGADLPITNGSTFTVAQLGSSYNLEAGTSGTIGSVKYTITGPTPTSNIENATPYNSPGTGSGAWTGSVGSYSVNLKTYSSADGTGILCHDTTITFSLSNNTYNCNCPGNVVLNPSFESGITNWSSSGGSLTQGTGGVACGTYSGDLNNTSSTSKAWQNIGTNLATGTVINVSVYAGTHDNSFNNYVAVEFLNSSNAVLGSSVYVQVDKILANSPAGPQLYTISTSVPVGATTTRVVFGGTGSYTKTDQWCVTLDPTPPPVTGERCFTSPTNPSIVWAKSTWMTNPANQTVTIRTTFSKTFVDNTYGTNTIGWPGGHSFSNLTGSDKLGWAIKDANGVTRLAFEQDYISSSAAFPSGYGCLGFGGDGGNPTVGSTTDVTAFLTSIDKNLNQNGSTYYGLTTNSPATNANYTPNPTYPNFIYDVWYEVTVKLSVFGSAGFGYPDIATVHASPSKTGNNTEVVNPAPCIGSLGDFVWTDNNGNGLQDAGENGIQGVTVTLTKPDNTTVTTVTNASGFYQFTNLSAGTYSVSFPATLAGGFGLTTANVGSDDSKDSDPSQGTGIASGIVLYPGQNNTTVDAGYVLSNLTLGNKVFYDLNRSGFNDAGDGLVAGATVRLYTDANNDNVADGAFIQAQQTNAFGEYSFTNLAPGNYIVGVVIPATYAITVVNGGDPDNNIDNDNNAIITIAGEARGNSISLASGTEPDVNINNTYDIGFYNPLAPPNGGENCFSGTNPIVYAKSYWNVNVNAQTVTMRVTFSKKFVDNTYGTAAIGWPGGHTFGNLTGSDHLQWSIRDANGVEKLAFKQDYVSASTAFPSGYGCLGFGGDGGNPTVGLTTDVLSFRTSIATNFNDYGYVLTTNSPATDTNYTPNPSQPNWIYDVWYEVTVKASVFGTAGFGFVNVASVHASPSKTGNNTEIITNNPCAAGSIGDRVWNDINKDGVQDANEVGLAGIVVTLYDGTTSKVLASTVTDGYGNYKFSGLETSVTGINYQVRFSPAAGYRLSPNNGLVTVTNNSDANITTGRTGTITLTNAVPNVTYVDAGMYYTETARVGDYVWNDLNKNGIQEAGEPGIAGVNVMLYTNANVLFRSTVTANNGLYYFSEVPAGTYYIKVSPPVGYQVSPKDAGADNLDSDIDPLTRQTPNFTVVAGTSNLTLDAGLNVTSTTGASASLGDKVWEDLNSNNIQDAGEPGIANVTVQLYDNANVLQATVTTDAFGNYIFNGLNPGSYYVKFTLPAGYGYVTANVGSNDAVDSDADGTGTTQTVTLIADEINTTVDAGMRRTTAGAALGDFVWYDLNKDGVQDGGSEVGVSGITVLLYNSSNVVVGTTTTDMNGYYLFTGLPAATSYTVGFENIPAGYGFSPNNGAATVTNNSDVNPSTGRTGNVITGAAGTIISYVDAGIIITPKIFDSKATVGDRVWNDLNNNGIQDAGEPGIPGVTVTLYAANGTTVIATTVTDALGNYLFTNLDAGTYVVGFGSLPAGYVFASRDAGTNDEKDSDADGVTGKTAPFTLAQGEINLSLDAGARNTSTTISSLGNFVWYDLNNNGIQDSGEPGAAGISVELTNMAGLVIGTTTTSAIGEYRFRDLAANNYFIKFTNLPAGYTIGQKNIGADDAVDSDPTLSTGKTDIIGLLVSTNDLTWDMGIVTTTRASVGDYVWNDINMNGIQDAGEQGVSGVTVTLYNNANVPVAQTITDANGFYLFSNVLPGTYSVGFSNIPASSTFTTQNSAGSTSANNSDADQTGRTSTFTLVGGQSKTDVDAGLVSLKAAVGDYVWNDVNRNGLQDATEAGVPGITVTMFTSVNSTIGDGDDVAVASAITDANGYYFINNVAVVSGGSQFYMRFTDLQSIYEFTLPLVGGTAASDNSKVTTQPAAAGRTGFFTLSPGQIYRDMDAGIYQLYNLSGNVWHDVNGMNDNLVNNTGPLMVPPAAPIPTGLRITMVDAATGIVLRSTLVAGNGTYNFINVAPGNYTLILSPLPGTPGQPSPFASLPTGWINTGEKWGLTPGRDPVINGKLTVSLTNANVINANFGIQLNNDDIGIN